MILTRPFLKIHPTSLQAAAQRPSITLVIAVSIVLRPDAICLVHMQSACALAGLYTHGGFVQACEHVSGWEAQAAHLTGARGSACFAD